MFLKKFSKILGWILLIVLFLAACAPGEGQGGEQQKENPTSSEAIGNLLPAENRQGRSGICPSSVLDGYYIVSTRVSFHEAATGTSMALCAQPGCVHMDETCQAWIGEVKSYTEYHGMIYAIRGNENIQFIQKNISNGNIEVLAEWKASDRVSYSASLNIVSDGMAVISLNSEISQGAGEDFRIETIKSVWLYDLETSEMRELLPTESERSVLALSRAHAVVLWYSDDQSVLTYEEFVAEYGSDRSYGNYLLRETNCELRLYNSDFDDYTVLTSTEQGFLPYSENNMTYGKELVYVEGDKVFLVNIDTGEIRYLLSLNGIINYWFMDEKVFLIAREGDVLDPKAPISLWYADVTDGVLVQMENGGRTDYMVFSVGYEGQSFFLGTNGSFISKTNFYAENYDAK